MKDAEAIRRELEELRKLLLECGLPSSENLACTVAVGALMWAAEMETSPPVSGFFKAVVAMKQQTPSVYCLAEAGCREPFTAQRRRPL